MSPFLAECQHDVSTRRADLWVGKCPIDIGMAVPNSSNMLSSQYLKTIFRYLHPSLYVTFLKIYSCFIFFKTRVFTLRVSIVAVCTYVHACAHMVFPSIFTHFYTFLHIGRLFFTHFPAYFHTFFTRSMANH